MKVVVTVDTSGWHIYAPGATGTLVGSTLVVTGKVVGSAVVAARGSAVLASWMAEVAALSVHG